jgi:spore maturation protein CgeB
MRHRLSLPFKSSRKKVWKAGYRLGADSGYRYGRCESIMRSISFDPPKVWNQRILYVTSGKGLPYAPLDAAIIESLKPMVKELITSAPVIGLVNFIAQIQPDLVLVMDGMLLSVDWIDQIRQLGFRTALWLADDPYYKDITVKFATHYDFVFTVELNCLAFYQQAGCQQVHYLPMGVHPRMHRPKPLAVGNKRDICFVGSGYWKRIRFFESIALFLSKKKVGISGIWWDRLPSYRLLSSKIELNKWMGPEETADYYNESKIVINLHRADDDTTYNNSMLIHAVSPNPRTFEISACGVLQLTDVRDDLARFYIPGQELVTYASAEELKEKIDYYLQHEAEMREIAYRGLQRTMREHTFTHRLMQLLQTVYGG